MTALTKALIAIAVGIGLAGGIAWAWNDYQNLVTDLATAKSAAKQAKRAHDDQLAENIEMTLAEAAKDRLLAERTRQRNQAQQALGRAHAEIANLSRSSDATVAKWAGDPVPSAALDIVCQHARCPDRARADAGPRTGGADGTHPGARGTGAIPDERGLTRTAHRGAGRARAGESR